jgi:uncharacterized integral membrane protein
VKNSVLTVETFLVLLWVIKAVHKVAEIQWQFLPENIKFPAVSHECDLYIHKYGISIGYT